MSPTYPRLSRALDAIYHLLWQANGRTVTVDDLYAAHKPGVKFAQKNQNVRSSICRLRAELASSGWPDCIMSYGGVGYYLDMDKSPPYRDHVVRAADLSGATEPLAVIPPPDRVADLEPTCWLSNRFLEVV